MIMFHTQGNTQRINLALKVSRLHNVSWSVRNNLCNYSLFQNFLFSTLYDISP